MTFAQRIKRALFTRYSIQSVTAKRAALARAYAIGTKLGRDSAFNSVRHEIDHAHSVVKLACADRDDAVAAMEGAHNAVFVLRKACEDRDIQIDNMRDELADLRYNAGIHHHCQCDTRGNH